MRTGRFFPFFLMQNKEPVHGRKSSSDMALTFSLTGRCGIKIRTETSASARIFIVLLQVVNYFDGFTECICARFNGSRFVFGGSAQAHKLHARVRGRIAGYRN